mgnify:CR=1 FL=1
MAEQVQLDIDIAAAKKELVELKDELSNVKKVGDTAFDGVSGDVKALAAEMQELIAVENRVNAEMKKSEQAAGGFLSRVRSGISDIQVFGKSLGEWGTQLGGIVGKMTGGAEGAGRLSGAFRLLGTAIKATGIGLLIGLIGSVIAYFTRFQSGIDRVSAVMSGLSATVTSLIKSFLGLAEGIGTVLGGIGLITTGNFQAGFELIKTGASEAGSALAGMASEAYNAAIAAYELEKRFQALRDAALTASVETARQQAVLEQYKRVVDDGTQSLGRRSAAAQKAGQIETEIANRQFDQALESLDLERQKFALSTKSFEDKQRLADAEKSFTDAQINRENVIYNAEKQRREFRKEASQERLKQISEETKALEKLKKDLENLRVEGEQEGLDKDLAEINRKYDRLAETARAGIAKLNEIEKRRALSPEEIAQREEFAALSVQLEERRLEALIGAIGEFNEKEAALNEEQAQRRKELSEKEQKALIDSINAQKAVREEQLKQGEAAVEAYLLRLKQQGATEQEIKEAQAEFDLLTQQARIRAEIDFQEKLLAATGSTDEARAEQIRQSIETLRAQLDNVNFQIDNPVKGKKKFDFFALIGLDPDDPAFEDKKKAVEKAFGEVIDGLERVTAARVEAAEAAVESADRQVESAQDALDREIEIAQLGFASNVDARRQDLEAAKKARETALENQKKAQRQQLALDSIQQASNIAVSTTNLIKSWSTLPFGIGLILAFAQAAQIFAFMSNIRAKAKAISNQQFRHGGQAELSKDGFIVGPSHDGGGVVPELEGGEFMYSDGRKMAVVKRSATQTHFDLLRAVNDDNRPAMRDYLVRLTGGIQRDTSATAGAASSAEAVRQGPDNRDLLKENNRLAAENNRLTKKMLDLEEGRVQFFDMGDYVLKVERGRETRIVKARR